MILQYFVKKQYTLIHGQGHGRRGGGDPRGPPGAREGGVVENFFTRGVVY